MRWGLIPSWSKRDEAPDFYKMFNSRADTAPDKPVFARLLARRRCIVFINGFCASPRCGCRGLLAC
jgi:putative SOS response-associated peptidase YedK